MWCHDAPPHRCAGPARVGSPARASPGRAYRFAAAGIATLAPASRPCVATALPLYSEILDRIEGERLRSVQSPCHESAEARRLQVAGIGLIAGVAGAESARASPHRRAGSLAIPDGPGGMPGDHRAAGDLRRRRLPADAAAPARAVSRWPWCFSSGTRSRSPATCGATTATTSPASSVPGRSTDRRGAVLRRHSGVCAADVHRGDGMRVARNKVKRR